ncbi:putative eukaryotic translation initiation factor subunit eIF-4F [Aspergillus vadensis CBS 113365]|uniref:Eukaryotic translation initiation factor subunit eIF-4F n=1 Tax=Aspergillus vadensis (strain CBS 113365 / IMI 142717 / IBT 24658) TaxID=1448311 RepID=A0A319BIU4_ASPVC|nr:eukaryotic translation initiation factor subunit eIF-4F [Aspergillus vadensis CBS 113365]PYH72211.1 eukaryotic translation initiation factor subunit eIF-4F [Aspergillus vadensis CBS 113365]
MSSIPPKSGLQPQGQSTSTQAASSAHTSSPSVGGKSSPQAPVPTPSSTSTTAPRSYANATKKSATDSTAAPVTVGGQSQHGKSTTASPVSGKPMQQSQTPGVTIVNGAPAPASQGDHTRKPSVTITSAGTSGYIPNGGQTGRPNSLQFGFAANQQSSPNMGNPAVLANQPQSGLGVTPPMNPRVTSPQTSPSPIPQPASSGGRPPPSSYQSQGNVPNFGSFGDSGDNQQMRPAPQAPLGPGAQSTHLRRESSQSTHSDMSNHMGGGRGGRGGYHHQGGRGRGFSQSSYQGQIPYSPNASFRSTPNQPRGGPNMAPQFPNQPRPMPFPNSPHQASRSPALANAHPATPQMNQVPMAHPQMAPQPYYGQPMPPQPVRPHPLQKPARRGGALNRKRGTSRAPVPPRSSAPHNPHITLPPNLAPESGHFERYLTMMKSKQGYPTFDPNYGFYPGYNMSGVPYMPPSPQPRPGIPYNPQAPYMQNQYPVQPAAQATALSRSPSHSNDRPGSSLGQGQPPAGAPGPAHAHNASRSSNSPAPQKSSFVIPTAKKNAVVIKDPGSGAVKTFEKAPASPARVTPSPVKIATPTSTPPPRTGSSADHTRTDSKSTKTDEEKKKELRDAVHQKIEQDRIEKEEAERRKAEEEAAQKKKEEEEEAARKKAEEDAAQKKKEEEEAAQKKAADEEAARKSLEDLSLKDKPAETKAEEPSKPAPAPAPADDDDTDYDAIEREMAEIEAKERAAEEAYYAKKKAEKEEKERKEKEELEAYEANMKNAEREAEAIEEARAKKREEESKDKDLFASLKKGGFPATEASTPGDSGAATPGSDTSMGPPAKPASANKREKPAALKLETTKAVEPPQPSAAMKALHSARFVDDLSKITYPESIASPNPALNASAPADRKFHYNKEFLLQFQSVFKEKPSIDWDARVRETVGDSDSSRPQSARTPMMGGRNSSRPGAAPFQMGNFGQAPSRSNLPPGTTSAERFAMSNAARTSSMGNPFGNFGRPGLGIGAPGLSRTNSASAMHPGMPSSPRVGSSNRSGTRTGSKRDKQNAKKEEEMAKSMPLTAGMEVKALQVSSTGWKPRSIGQAPAAAAGPTPAGAAYMPPDMVQRKVKAALNKMTPENFDRISGQLLEIVSQSKDETDGRTLRQVIQLTFEKATDEAHWASIYAKFCKRMLESMSAEIKDENIHDKNGNVVAGGSLFRKYLLNRCQEEFERGWKVNLPPKPEGETEEAAMMSDEYYKAAAAKRRGLGLVKFIGELYKLGMLTERIMHECVKKLVDYEGMPDEAEVESLTSLLRTIGASLDVSEKGHAFMNAYFHRIGLMIQTPGLPSRLRFMLMDIVDLRSARWQSKDADKGPKTIQQIREEAARAQQEAEMERLRQQANRGSRPGLGRGDARSYSGYGNQAPPQDFASSKVGSDDLRRLRTSRQTNQPMSFGPSSMLGSRSNSGRKNLGPGGNLVRGSDDSAASSRTGTPTGKKEDKEAASSINAFSALASLEDRDNMATSPPSNPTSPLLTKSQPAVERRPSKTPSKDGEEAS